MYEILRREFIYLWYYFTVILQQILPYWIIGMLIGSLISVFGKSKIHRLFENMKSKKIGIFGIIPACMLGIISPICMYGTIPIVASFSRHGMREDWLAAFMMSSILLNPQLIIYSAALGSTALIIRITAAFICGISAGLLVYFASKNKPFFNFSSFNETKDCDADKNIFVRFIKSLGRNIKATGLYFLIGILLTAAFQRYVPAESFAAIFGSNKALGVLTAAALGVPLYVCGGGTIPMIQEFLYKGMSMGSAAAFMMSGPSTKITNLGALKIVLGTKKFILYIIFVILYAVSVGVLVNIFI